jgi:TAZ zinc finger
MDGNDAETRAAELPNPDSHDAHQHRRVAGVTNQMKNSVKVCVTNSKAYCCCTTLPNVLAAGAARSLHCADMKLLWKHMEACKDKHWKVTHCRSSRWILKHYRKCVDVNCSVCGPVRTAVRNSKHAASTTPTMGSNDDTQFSGSTCSTQKQSNVSTPGSQSPLGLQQAPQLPPLPHTAQEHLPSQSPHTSPWQYCAGQGNGISSGSLYNQISPAHEQPIGDKTSASMPWPNNDVNMRTDSRLQNPSGTCLAMS